MAEVHDVLAYKKQTNFGALWEEFQAQGRFTKVLIVCTFLASVSTMALAGTSLTLINYAAEPIAIKQSPQITLLAYGGNRRGSFNWTNSYSSPTPTPTRTSPTSTPTPTIAPTNTATANLRITSTPTPAPVQDSTPTADSVLAPTTMPMPAQTSAPTTNSILIPTTTPAYIQDSTPVENSIPITTPTSTPMPTQNSVQQIQHSVVSAIDNFLHITPPTDYSTPDSSGNDSHISLPQAPTPIPTSITPRETNFFKFTFDVIAKANSSVASLTGNLFSNIIKVFFPTLANNTP